MSNPQYHASDSDDCPASGQVEPESRPQHGSLRDDHDPGPLIALLRQWSEELSLDPEADWAAFLQFAQGIAEERLPGSKVFEEYCSR
jgi:hypothetical protein